MGDALSIVPLIVTLLGATQKLVKVGHAFYNAKEGHEKNKTKLESLKGLVDIVEKRLDEARQESDCAWHKIILDHLENVNSPLTRLTEVTKALEKELRLEPKTEVTEALEKELRLEPKTEVTEALEKELRLEPKTEVTEALEKELRLEPKTEITEARGKELRLEPKIRLRERLLYYWKKKKIRSHFAEIYECWTNISDVLGWGHYELSKNHQTLLSGHGIVQKDHLTISKVTNERVERIEGQVLVVNHTLSRREEEQMQRRLRKNEESLREAIGQWLSPLEFQARQRDLFSKCFPAGQWFLKSEEFTSWIKGRPWQLRCYGDTGCGKTCLSSIVIHHLEKKYQPERSPVLWIYLTEKESENQTPENLLGSVLRQLVQMKRSKPIIPQLGNLYESNRAGGKKPTLQEMLEIFEAELKGLERIYLIIDGLNECSPKSRGLVEHELSRLCSKNLSLMVTSTECPGRSAEIICDNCGRVNIRIYFHCGVCKEGGYDLCENCEGDGMTCLDRSHAFLKPSRVEVEVCATDDEIREYVRKLIDEEMPRDDSEGFQDLRVRPNKLGTSRLATKLAKDPSLLERIPEAVLKRTQGNFLLVKLYMESLLAMRTLKEINDTLKTFPASWEKFYEERMQDRIKGQKDEKDRALALKVLSLATSARRPLTLVELKHALAIEPGDFAFDPEKDFEREFILDVTKGLLTIDDGDDANSYVRFFHLTLQKYLDESKDRWFPQAELHMATACLTCLQYSDFSQRSEREEDLEAILKRIPFAAYALQFWGDHVRNTITRSSTENVTFHFLEDTDRLGAVVQAAWYSGGKKSSSWDVPGDVDALHIYAWFGLSSLILNRGLENHDVNVREQTYGQTPLIYACKRGHVEAARQLLELGANVNAASEQGKTPLMEAIEGNHREVVDLLLDRGELEINAKNSRCSNRTALIGALQLDLDDIVKTLLNREDIDVNSKDKKGFTVLSLAAAKGSYEVVKALLNKPQIDVNSVDVVGGRTALILVTEFAKKKECEIIRALIRQGADPNLRDYHRGRTALSVAVKAGRIQVVETLLEFDQTDHFCKDDDGRGLLHYASKHGHADIIRLLKRKQLDLNLQDNHGFTPLHDAALAKNSAAAQIIELLLGLGADPSVPDHSGRTPFACASVSGDSDLANVLKKKVNIGDSIEAKNGEGLPVWILVNRGYVDLISEAITAGRANLNENEPGTGASPLHIAVSAGRDDILQMLLKDGKMDINSTDQFECTPLHRAAVSNRKDALNMLLKENANLDLRDFLGFTPLARAVQKNHLDFAITLIEAGATFDPNAVNMQKMVFAAVKGGRITAVTMFKERNLIDWICKNREGLTIREVAKTTGNEEMIILLDASTSFGFESLSLPLRSNESVGRILPLMPSPPTGLTPIRAVSEDLSEKAEDAQLEEILEGE